MSDTTAPQPRRTRRWPWVVLGVVVAIPVAAAGAAYVFLDPEKLRPRLVAAVEQATGRRFELGEMRLALSLVPTVELRDISLANPEGFSRPAMLTARRVEVQAALLPLLSRRVEVARVVVEEPDLLLETRQDGTSNWVFARPAAPGTPAAPAAPESPTAPGQPLQLAVDSLRLERGTLAWRDAHPGGRTETLGLTRIEAAAPAAGPSRAEGDVALRGQAVSIAFQGGRLSAFGAAEPWPVDLRLASLGAEVALRGTLAAGQAWTAEVTGRAADLTRLAPLMPDVPLPPLRDVALAGAATGTGGALATLSGLNLRIGESDLSTLRPGLRLASATLTAERPDAPLALQAEARLADQPLRLSGRLGTPAQLAGQAPGPLPVDVRLETNGAAATLAGRIADPRALSGVDLAITAEAADLAALSPLAGTALPPIREVRLSTRLAERTPGFAGGAHLRDLRLASSAGEAAGEVTLVVGERPGITGRLASPRLDLDALRAATAAAPAPAGAPAAPAAPAPTSDGRVIPDIALPMAALRVMDADLRLEIAALTLNGQAWRQVVVPVKIDAGRGGFSPLTAQTPAGPLALDLTADARAEVPTLRILARSPGLDLTALQAMAGQPNRLSGRAELDADLRGQGNRLRQVAATLSGHLGLAMLGGHAEPALVQPVQAALRERVPVLPPLPNRLPIECIAIRADAEGGTARLSTLLLDSPAAKVAGTGSINLGDESLSLRMLHDVRAAGAEVRVSADLGGTLASPAYRGVRAENLAAVLGNLAGQVGGDLGAVLGALAPRGNNAARPAPLPDCGPALTAARGGREGQVPAARPAPAAAEAAPAPQPQAQPERRQGIPQPADLLRGLLGR
ncbi:AsmA family protein [Roseomonas stagni]|uniref:AsmA family protein n=1 Tax=Falsiroseomonas algicola TaxID=2716930 RepID=A0A6M1LUU5_9PROT|nr:AsmA family protein [Falsiroseomonas algicola]NGM24265.1 AsmA family protein [Falsiroseomonas algicola]